MKMNKIETKKSGIIRVSDITIGQLSRGLYRSTATAFKELVNNAYDADATVVRIDTNYPEFNFISCADDGTGMTLEEFTRFFSKKGIGSCIKRKGKKEDLTDIYKRPIIGRLGIGMLAIGQLCHSFKIESHYKYKNGKKEAYLAKINLSDVEFPFPDKEQVIRNLDLEHTEIDVGTWEYDDTIDYDEKKQGFRIYSQDVRNTFKREMKASLKEMEDKEREKISFSQPDLHSQFYDTSRSVRDCKPYLETIWELAILCPIPYYGEIEKYPINLSSFPSEEIESNDIKQAIQFIKERQSKLINYNFRVVFDGIELRRHIQLPMQKDAMPKLYFINFNDIVFTHPLKFAGYIFAQIPKAIQPLELNGVQIRLREVGIGGYDSTFLKYYKEIATIRSRWVSGEIFVDKGLESALNIDRDSFNEHDEHYKKLQSVLHEKLDKVFDKINAIARKLSEEKRDLKDEKLKEEMKTLVKNKSSGKLKLEQRDLGNDFPMITFDDKKRKIILNTALRPLKRKKSNIVLQSVELAYHIALHMAKNEKDRHDIFYALVKEISDRLV